MVPPPSASGLHHRSMIPLGIRFYGLGALALGAVGIVWGDFALLWQPVAPWVPGRTVLAYLFAAALLIAGAGVLNPFKGRSAEFGSAALAVLYGAVVVLMHGPLLFLHAASLATWSGVAQ